MKTSAILIQVSLSAVQVSAWRRITGFCYAIIFTNSTNLPIAILYIPHSAR